MRAIYKLQRRGGRYSRWREERELERIMKTLGLAWPQIKLCGQHRVCSLVEQFLVLSRPDGLRVEVTLWTRAHTEELVAMRHFTHTSSGCIFHAKEWLVFFCDANHWITSCITFKVYSYFRPSSIWILKYIAIV